MNRLDSRMYRLAFLETANPAIITDENFVIREANEACLDLGGFERSDLIGEVPAMLFEDHAVFEEVADALADGRPWVGDFEARTRDGQLKYGRGSAAPLVADGETLGYVAIFIDMTAARQTRESLRILNRVLRHNLRNDANVVLGNLRSVRDGLDGDDVAAVDAAIDRVEGMLNRAETTRQFGRLLAADGSETLYPVRLDNAVDQALANVADETLTAAVRAVIDNAVVHGGDEPTVEITAAVDDGDAVLLVADDGPGIEAERQDRIFGREELSEVRHGEGLSLFFVDRLLTVYGGEVSVADNEPTGSVFELRFRRAEPDEALTGSGFDW
ncbi:MAG: sensor histidine kinase [Halolamina sp.]